MTSWIPYSFVRITIVFIAGILLNIYYPGLVSPTSATVLLGIAAALFLLLVIVAKRWWASLNTGFVGLLVILLSGYVLVNLRTNSYEPNHIIHFSEKIEYYTVVTTGYTQEKDKSWRVEGKVKSVYRDHDWHAASGTIQLYFSKADFQSIQYGDEFFMRGAPSILTPPANPGEFDYKRFLSFKNIHHQHFVRAEDAQWLGNNPPSIVRYHAIQFRDWSKRQLYRFVTGEQEQAIASALVLGVTDNLDDDTLHAYAATGAMHVLAVSGLHVGIIYAILLFFLRPLTKRTGGDWLLAVVSLLILWAYAFITGLSPSVLRAVTMFSLVALARPFKHATNIFNILAASAFCLLIVDPYLIMSVGFQLSYLAVLGIVYLQRPIYQWWVAPTWLLDKIWQITTVSIAAQLSTVSLGLLYFHQFPVYFLFSNLLVIPLSFVVLIAGLLLLAVSFFNPLAVAVGWLLESTIKIMNGSVQVVESLPFSLLEDVYITTPQSWVIMGVIIFFVEMWMRRDIRYIVGVFFLATILSVTQWNHHTTMVNKRVMTVYKVSGHRAIDFIEDGKTYSAIDSVLLHDRDRIRFHIRPNRLLRGVADRESLESLPALRRFDGYDLLRWGNRTILLISNKVALPSMEVDDVVISNNAIALDELTKAVHFKNLILDSSNSSYFSKQLLEDAHNSAIFVHAVNHQGAYTATL
jgi:competence protein ComEC